MYFSTELATDEDAVIAVIVTISASASVCQQVWGTVCDPWYLGFARAVCRQLGYEVDHGAGVFSNSKPSYTNVMLSESQ